VRLKTLAVRCRSAVERDGYSREIVRIPDAEAPGRLALVLRRILDALAVIGCDENKAWEIVTKVALDSMEATRRAAIEYLLAAHAPVQASVVADRLGYPTTTTVRVLEDLAAHHVVERESRGQGKATLWRPSEWLRDRWPEPLPKCQDSETATSPETSEGQKRRNGNENAPEDLPSSFSSRVGEDFSGEVRDDLGAWCSDDGEERF
jgi:hypothetical protein